MAEFPMKFKLAQQTTDRKESGNTYKLTFKYDAPSEHYYERDMLKGTLAFSASDKDKIDGIKEKLNILNIGEIFFLNVSKDPRKKLDEFLFPEKVEIEEITDPFEQFKIMIQGMSGSVLSPRFYEMSEEIKKIEEKKRKSKADKERLEFLKKCHEHLEEQFFIPPQEPSYYQEPETTEESEDMETVRESVAKLMDDPEHDEAMEKAIFESPTSEEE